jgi:hypothetical protein
MREIFMRGRDTVDTVAIVATIDTVAIVATIDTVMIACIKMYSNHDL